MKKSKKLLSIFLSIMMVLSILPSFGLTAHAVVETFDVSTTTIVNLENYITVTNNKDGTITAHMPKLSASKVTLNGTEYSLHYGYELVSSGTNNGPGAYILNKVWSAHTAFSSQEITIDITNGKPYTGLLIAGHPSNGTCLAPNAERFWGSYRYLNPVQITYDLNGGNIGGSTANKTEYLFSGDTLATTINTPQRTNYLFKGWYTAASGGTKVTASNATEATTYYAQWETRTVTLNGGNNATRSGGSVNQNLGGTAMTTVKYTANSGYAFKQSDFPKSSNGITATWKSDTTVEVAGTPTSSVSLTVPDAKPRASITAPTANELTYNGSSRNLVSAGSASGGTMYYAVTTANTMPAASSYSTTIPKGTNAGTYYVWYKAVGDANHTDTTPASVTVTVNKAEVTAPTISSKTYNAQAQTADVTASSLYSVTANAGGTNVGSYDVVLTLTDAANYKWTDSTKAAKTLTFTITQATPVVTGVTAKTLTYNTQPQTLVTAGSTTGGTLLYSVDGVNYSDKVPTATNAGTYTVYNKVQGNANYFDVAPVTVGAEIKKATPVATIKTKDLYFNNDWQELIQSDALTITGAVGDVDISDEAKLWYSLEGGLNELDYSPVGKKIGAYDCYYRIEALTDNVNAVDYAAEPFATVNIYAVPILTMTDYTYGSTTDELPVPSVEGNMGDGTVTYYYYPADGDAADAVVWDDSTTELTLDAGDYKMYAVIAESDTALGVTTEAVDFTVGVKTVDAPTITYSLADNTYNGSEITPTVNVKDGDVVIDPSEYTVTYSENINAGTATITVTDAEGGNYTVSGTKTFVIKKAPINPTITVAGWTYGDEANEPVVTGNTGNGAETITYKVKNASDDTYTAEVPVNAGTYTVKLVIAETDNYLGKTVTSDFTIAKADIAPEVTIEDWTYGDEANEPEVTGNDGEGDVTYTYAVKDSDEFTADVPVNAGDYTVKAVIAATANYNGGVATADFTIEKKDPEMGEGKDFNIVALELVYNGLLQNLITEYVKEDSGLVIRYSFYPEGKNPQIAGNIPRAKAIGEYEIYYMVEGTNNYNDVPWSTEPLIATIDEPTFEVTIEGWTYGDEANEPEVTGNTEAEVTITYAVKDSDEFSATVPTEAGDYTVKAVIAATDYYSAIEATADFTIEKADIAPTVSIEGWSFGDEANDPEVTGNTENGEVTITYAAKDSDEFTADVPTEAGDYTVKATIAETANYNGGTATADFTIAKADIAPTVSIDGWTYNQSAKTPSVSGNTGNGAVTYTYATKGSDSFSATVPTNAGNYTVKATIAATANYNGGTATADFTIAKANITPTVSISGWTYGQTAKTPSVSGNSGNGTVTYTYATKGSDSFSATVPTNAGNYTVKATIAATANYNGGTATADFTIAKANITPTVSIEGWTYNQTAKTPSVSGNSGNGTVTYTYATKGSDSFSATVPTNAGNYTVKATIAATTNYNGKTVTADFTIAKANITPTVSIEGWTYNQTAKTPSVSGNSGNGTVTYTYATKGSDSFSATVPTNAGNYTVKATIAATTNYNGATATADFTIAKADIAPTVSLNGWTYGTDANTPVVDGNTGNGNVTYTYAVYGSDSFSEAVPTDAGEYTVKASIAATANYNGGTATADFTIAKANITPTVSIEGWTYNQTAKTPSVSGNSGNGTVTYTYAVRGSDDFSETVPTAVNEYTVKATIAATDNYNGKTVTADFAISKANIAPTVSIEGWTYCETANTPSVTGNTGEGEVTYTYVVKGSDAFSETVPTNAGNYTVKATIAATTNYNGATATADFTIAKAKVTITADNKSSKREAALAKLTYKVDGKIYDGDSLGIKVTTNAKAAVAGKYAIKVSYTENANYDVTVVNGTYTVIDRITTSEKTAGKNKINSAVKATVNKDGSVTAKWGAVANVQRFEIYANYCGEKNEYKKIATFNGDATGYKITKLNGKKVTAKDAVKFYVVAYRKVDGKYTEIAKTITLHTAGVKHSKTNAKSIKVKKDSFTLGVNKTATIKPTLVLQDSKKKPVDHVAKFRYQSTNTAVATVDANGKITAVGKGTCTIYIFANNGKLKSVKVTVK